MANSDKIFQNFSTLYLSELDQDPHMDDLFLFGKFIAEFNKGGMLLTNLTPKGMKLDTHIGHWRVTDIGPLAEVKLDPVNMKAQFIEMYSTWGDMMLPIFAGYCRDTYLNIDPVCPGYTDTLIEELFSGNVLSRPKPSPLKFNLSRFLDLHNIKISYTEKSVEKSATLSNFEWHEGSVIITFIVLLLSGINTSNYFEYISKADSNISRFLKSILFCSKDEEYFTTLNISIFSELIQASIQDFNSLKNDEKIFRKIIDMLNKLDNVDRLYFIEAIYDGLVQVSCLLDKANRVVDSIDVAGNSLIYLQYLAKLEYGLEERICTMDLNNNAFSWSRLKVDDEFDLNTFLHYCTYNTSMTLTELNYFATSSEMVKAKRKRNYLWSSLMEAIERHRVLITQCNEILKKQLIDSSSLDNFIFILKHIIGLYIKAIRCHFDTILNYDKNIRPSIWFNCWANDGKDGKEFIMRKESRLTVQLYNHLEEQNLSKRTLETLSQLNDIILEAK